MSKNITLAAGCFWCTEAVFKNLKGVKTVVPGYMGGHTQNPTYKEVCTGATGHVEVLLVGFDPRVISFIEILDVFWHTHDPTTLNRQGNDVGTQYRSAIFCHDEEQLRMAEESKSTMDNSGKFESTIVTEIKMAVEFYPAEDYHHDYYALNGHEPYCQAVVRPKVEKFKKQYYNKLNDGI